MIGRFRNIFPPSLETSGVATAARIIILEQIRDAENTTSEDVWEVVLADGSKARFCKRYVDVESIRRKEVNSDEGSVFYFTGDVQQAHPTLILCVFKEIIIL